MMAHAAAIPPVDEALVDWSPGETRVAFLRDRQPWELLISRTSQHPIVGNVYVGRVVGVDRGLGFAFVDIGEDRPGMLKLAGNAGSVHEGQKLPVQAARDAYGDKGPSLSHQVRLPGRYVIFTPGRAGLAASRRIADPAARQRLQGLVKSVIGPGEGIVVRTAAAHAAETDMVREIDRLRSAWRDIEERAGKAEPPGLLHRELPPLLAFLRDALPAAPVPVRVDDRQTMAMLTRFVEANLAEYAGLLDLHESSMPLFEEREVEAEIEATLGRDWPLPGGGSISIERTRALTAVDVDTGGSHRKAVNLEAACEAARLIRFRNVSGLIAIDFAGAGPEVSDRSLTGAIRRGFADDRASVRFGSLSEFGLFEMSRERLGPSLDELLTGAGSGRASPNAETRLISTLRRLVRSRPPPPECVVEASTTETDLLEGPLASALREAELRLGYPVSVVPRLRPA